MDTKFVRVRFNVHCKWKDSWPIYRIYVNHELFIERTFKLNDSNYIKEMLQVQAVPGIYSYWLEQVSLKGEFTISDPYIESGDAIILPDNKFEIL